MHSASSIPQLLKAYLENHEDPEVLDQLRRLSEQEGMEEQFHLALAQLMEEQERNDQVINQPHYEQLFRAIMAADKSATEGTGSRVVPIARSRWWWAAAVLVVITGGAAAWYFKTNQPAGVITEQKEYDLQPGKSGAILVLANGSKLVLDSLQDGIVAREQGAKVVLSGGQLTYSKEDEHSSAVTYNTMVTPKGRQFQVALPDGTRVWLNAASSLRYPTAFTGTERKVEITGEAYFEVASLSSKGGKKISFKVVVNNLEINVLGTHFNVNTYTDEPDTKVTLLEGAVKVTHKGASEMLKPGEQAQLNAGGSLIKVTGTDMAKVMAWKNGLFNFEGMPISQAMRQLARWYDIEVVYEQGIPDIVFGGKMPMDINLSQLMLVLKDAGVHYRLEAGNRLVIVRK